MTKQKGRTRTDGKPVKVPKFKVPKSVEKEAKLAKTPAYKKADGVLAQIETKLAIPDKRAEALRELETFVRSIRTENPPLFDGLKSRIMGLIESEGIIDE
ncbi:hypothetical protein HY990_03805 [Candidatus Micrarchaeota archaeon]|nr:hypothetical protein [Candidatus Micrarchaeota archaeon]